MLNKAKMILNNVRNIFSKRKVNSIVDTVFDRNMSYEAKKADVKRKSDLDNAIRNSVK